MNSRIAELLQNTPVIIDGGLSNVLEGLGCDLNHPLWSAAIIQNDPDALIQTHKAYAEAGAQILSTASYQATFKGLEELGYSNEESKACILKSVDLVNKAIDQAVSERSIVDRPLVAGSFGPYGAYLSDGSEYSGNYGVTHQELEDFHLEKISLLASSGIDLLAFETIPSKEEAEVIAEILCNYEIPAWISFSCRDGELINDGTPIEEVGKLLNDHPSVFAIGVNCTAPEHISSLVRKLRASCSKKQIVIYPNSGEVFNAETKEWDGAPNDKHFTEWAQEWVKEAVGLIGGCCRVGPQDIRTIKSLLKSE